MMQNNRIQYLDLIRGGLILYVVFYHMSMQFGLYPMNQEIDLFYSV